MLLPLVALLLYHCCSRRQWTGHDHERCSTRCAMARWRAAERWRLCCFGYGERLRSCGCGCFCMCGCCPGRPLEDGQEAVGRRRNRVRAAGEDIRNVELVSRRLWPNQGSLQSAEQQIERVELAEERRARRLLLNAFLGGSVAEAPVGQGSDVGGQPSSTPQVVEVMLDRLERAAVLRGEDLLLQQGLEDSYRKCSICLVELCIAEPEEVGSSIGGKPVLLDCGHIFHRNCARQWLMTQATCPECRANVCLEGGHPTAISERASISRGDVFAQP